MPGKLQKFAEVESFSNCFALPFENIEKPFLLKGKWREDYFGNSHSIVLELGCGKGEYTIGLAERHPEKNFIGVDIKGNRIWNGARQAMDAKMENVAFLRTRIDFIVRCFAPGEVDEIWITFPDPQPQKTRARKRLTHPMFLERYRTFLKPGGLIHLKTDSTGLYEYTLEMIGEAGLRLHWHTPDLDSDCPPERSELKEIRTYYENLFSSKGEKIKYILFSLK
jgi:tRNA (guanine-N7-)-methyltransferase